MATQKKTNPVRHVALAHPVSLPWMALLAMQDYRARAAMDECQRLGLDIPHDVAVLGMEDDPTVCEFCRPTLSSVSRNGWQLGYETAALLDRLMDGRSPPSHDILVPSDGVVARQSTDTVAVVPRRSDCRLAVWGMFSQCPGVT